SQIKLSPHITGFEANKRIITGTGTQGGDLITAKFGNQIKKTRVDHHTHLFPLPSSDHYR
ncbi:hypothetical protein WP50_11370, partial [Lactiplantibacillus plantarum]